MDKGYERITKAMIPAEGGVTYGARYALKDHRVISGETYHYRLEAIDTEGESTYHGPISVIVGGISVSYPEDQGALPANPPATFQWIGDGADRFRIQFSKHSDFKSGVISLPGVVKKNVDRWAGSSSITDQHYTPNAKEWKLIRDLGRNGETIYCRVHGKTKAGKDVYSKGRSFRFPAGKKAK